MLLPGDCCDGVGRAGFLCPGFSLLCAGFWSCCFGRVVGHDSGTGRAGLCKPLLHVWGASLVRPCALPPSL